MAGLFNDITNFFTGDEQNDAAKAVKNQLNNANDLQSQGKATTATGVNAAKAGVSTLQGNADTSQNQAADLYNQQTAANSGVQQSLGSDATQTTQKANAAAQTMADQNANLSSTAAARAALSAARTGGLNQGQAALSAGQNVGTNYLNSYQQGLGEGLNTYNQAVTAQQNQANSLAGQTQAEQGLSNQAALGAGGLGSSLANIGVTQQTNGLNAALNAAGVKTQQANTDTAAGGDFLGGIANTVQKEGEEAAKLIALKDGTQSSKPGPTLVGEKGPEILNLPAGSQVTSNPQTRKIMKKEQVSTPAQLRKVLRRNPDAANQVPAHTPGTPDQGLTPILEKLTSAIETLISRLPQEVR